MAFVTDLTSKLKIASESVPTQADVVHSFTTSFYLQIAKIKSIDAEEMRKIDDKIKKEESESMKEHGSCGDVSYVRDYSFECPEGWVLTTDGSCWFVRSVITAFRGMNYRGNCDSKQSFKWFSVGQKKDIFRSTNAVLFGLENSLSRRPGTRLANYSWFMEVFVFFSFYPPLRSTSLTVG
ncbi:hypothetical protein MACJ_000052 [Theileria orientalis]|uniref:CPW-WPC domain-containing protein n=1 Tax=Theileria orientalis TaxID=68886 RepID=A0A976QR28_THEOR|nr:hypothetical protein MACJ_000052 [Theileria orientalis]